MSLLGFVFNLSKKVPRQVIHVICMHYCIAMIYVVAWLSKLVLFVLWQILPACFFGGRIFYMELFDFVGEPEPPKPIQCLEITSPFVNYKVSPVPIPTDT